MRLALFIAFTCENQGFKISTDALKFTDTPIRSEKSILFSMKNTATITSAFEFSVLGPNDSAFDKSIAEISVYPRIGYLPPGREMEVLVSVKPKELISMEAKLICSAFGNANNTKLFELPLLFNSIASAVALEFPFFYNSLILSKKYDCSEDSDFLVFEGVGLERIKRSFQLHNLASDALNYFWKINEIPEELYMSGIYVDEANTTQHPHETTIFRCKQMKGILPSNESVEIQFECAPKLHGSHMSHWILSIPSLNYERCLVLVASIREPCIYFDTSIIQMNCAPLGKEQEAIVYAINSEDVPLQLSIIPPIETECDLRIQPNNTIAVPPNSKSAVCISFIPRAVKWYNFFVRGKVKGKQRDLRVNVKCEGCMLRSKLKIKVGENQQTFDSSHSKGTIDFGELKIGEASKGLLTLQNIGKLSFDFKWVIQRVDSVCLTTASQSSPGSIPLESMLSITPNEGTVEFGQEVDCTALYNSLDAQNLQNYSFCCYISNEKSYELSLRGRGILPLVEFSFLHYDFGLTFVKPELPEHVERYTRDSNNLLTNTKRVDLLLKNMDAKNSCIVEIEPNETDDFKIMLGSNSIPPGDFIRIPTVFLPKDTKEYATVFSVVLNHTQVTPIHVRGRGSSLRLDTIPEKIRAVNFGTTIVGRTLKRLVHIKNYSETTVKFSIVNNIEEFKAHGLSVIPLKHTSAVVSLNKREFVTLEISYSPLSRGKPFSLPLIAQCHLSDHYSTWFPVFLLELKGRCLSTKVYLSETEVYFGTVKKNSWCERRIGLQNDGDVIVFFRFVIPKHFAKLLFVSPSQGSLNPHESIPVKFNIQPKSVVCI